MRKIVNIAEHETFHAWAEPARIDFDALIRIREDCQTPITPYQPPKRIDWLNLGLAILVLCAFVAILSVMWEWNV